MKRDVSTDTKSKRTPREVMQSNLVFWADHADRLAAQIDALVIRDGNADDLRMAEFLRRELIAARKMAQQCAVDLGPYEMGKINTVNPPPAAQSSFGSIDLRGVSDTEASIAYMRIIQGE